MVDVGGENVDGGGISSGDCCAGRWSAGVIGARWSVDFGGEYPWGVE